jgi:hypothetical protein
MLGRKVTDPKKFGWLHCQRMRTLKYPFRVFYGPGSKKTGVFYWAKAKTGKEVQHEKNGDFNGVVRSFNGFGCLGG